MRIKINQPSLWLQLQLQDYKCPTKARKFQWRLIFWAVITSIFVIHISANHVSHLEHTPDDQLNRLLSVVIDIENLFLFVHKEEDTDTKQVYFYLFKVRSPTQNNLSQPGHFILLISRFVHRSNYKFSIYLVLVSLPNVWRCLLFVWRLWRTKNNNMHTNRWKYEIYALCLHLGKILVV